MSNLRKAALSLFMMMTAVLSFMPDSAYAQLDSQLSVNVNNSPLKGVLELIAARAGLQLVMEQDPSVNITLSESNTTAKKLLDQLSAGQEIEYSITGNRLIITKRSLGSASQMGDARKIPVNFAKASTIAGKLASVVTQDERVLVDEDNNALIFLGSDSTYEKVLSLVALFDAPVKQIMIEAQIVETSDRFLRDIGVSISDTGASDLSRNESVTGFTTTPGPSTPTVSFKAILGQISGRNLDMRLTAAETRGEAKVISRPKVVTLNNKAAKVSSGITYHIKTLSSVQSGNTGGGGQTGGVVTGGVTSVEAGLLLSILPTIVGKDKIKLLVDINNSQPDQGTAVDGIPGISKNAANTSVIVGNRETAVIAGLKKQSDSEGNTGVPILSDIPILGALFRSDSRTNMNNEMVIFLTPTIDDQNENGVFRVPASSLKFDSEE